LAGLLIEISIQLSHEIKVLAEFGASPEENSSLGFNKTAGQFVFAGRFCSLPLQ
jgi:hypothetical protein